MAQNSLANRRSHHPHWEAFRSQVLVQRGTRSVCHSTRPFARSEDRGSSVWFSGSNDPVLPEHCDQKHAQRTQESCGSDATCCADRSAVLQGTVSLPVDATSSRPHRETRTSSADPLSF